MESNLTGLISLLNWVFTGVALAGAFFVSNLNQERGLKLWLGSNFFFSAYNFYIGNYAGVVLFFVYFCITLYGLNKLRR